jgi:hypothetical protein
MTPDPATIFTQLSHPLVRFTRSDFVQSAIRNGVDLECAGVLADLSRIGLDPLIDGVVLTCGEWEGPVPR